MNCYGYNETNGRPSLRPQIPGSSDFEAGLERLQEEIAACNKESGLDIQLVLDEPKAFDPKYGHFEGVENYIALIGRKGEDLDEKCGYYGEKIVLFAQSLGLNTCWVGVTYKQIEGTLQIGKDETSGGDDHDWIRCQPRAAS